MQLLCKVLSMQRKIQCQSHEKAPSEYMLQMSSHFYEIYVFFADRLDTANKQLAAMEVEDQSQHVCAKLVEQSK